MALRERRLHVGGRLDRYVARLFAGSYVTAFLVVVGLFLIIDMAGNLDDFLEPDDQGRTHGLEVVRFYALQIPFLYLKISPFVTLVAGLFVGVRLVRTSEVVAALSAGISSRRLFAPLFALALVLAVGMFAMREWAGETLGRQRDALLDRLSEQRSSPVFEDFWVSDDSGRALRIREYRPGVEDGGAGPPTIHGLMRAVFGGSEDTILTAESAVWSQQEQAWIFEGGWLVEIGERAKRQSRIDGPLELGITPADVLLAYKGRESPLERSFSECLALLAREPGNARYRTLFHYHLSFPLAGLVLLACGLPFVMGHERGRAFERLAGGMGMCLLYVALEFIARTMGMAGQLGPILASWLPVIFFGSLGLVLFGSMRS